MERQQAERVEERVAYLEKDVASTYKAWKECEADSALEDLPKYLTDRFTATALEFKGLYEDFSEQLKYWKAQEYDAKLALEAHRKIDTTRAISAILGDGGTHSTYFITITCPQAVEGQFVKTMLDWKPKWIEAKLMVFEQRGETAEEMGTGVHAHLAVITAPNVRKSADVRLRLKAVKAFAGWVIKVDPIKTEADARKILNYMVGEKADPEKHKKQIFWTTSGDCISVRQCSGRSSCRGVPSVATN